MINRVNDQDIIRGGGASGGGGIERLLKQLDLPRALEVGVFINY